MEMHYLKDRGWISVQSQHDGLTMVNVTIGRAGSHVYDLTINDCLNLSAMFAAEARRQEQAKHDDERLHAALAADEMKEAA